MILCVGPTPAAQRVMVFPKLVLDGVNRATRTAESVAGKSVNVAKVLNSLGEKVVATGFAGGDRGAKLVALLKSKGIDADFIEVVTPTRQCTTVIDQSAGTITELVEESQPAPAAAYDELKALVQRRLQGTAAVVMSGTITPGGPADFYRWCTQFAKKNGALSVVDAQGVPLTEALKAQPGLVKPNRSELSATVGKQLEDQGAVLAAMRELHDRGARHIVVTAGKDPTVAFDGHTFWRISSPAIKVINPI